MVYKGGSILNGHIATLTDQVSRESKERVYV